MDSNAFKQNLLLLCGNIPDTKFLLTVSGGADSMVLAHLFKELSLNFEIAHVNYHFRDEDADLDQKLVETFCQNHGVKFHLKDVSEKEKEGMTSLQTWARELRYHFFFDLLETEKLDFMVTAHHLNDELETFLINLSRGSGIKGLSGMPRNKNRILRPLLNYSKEEIYTYAKDHGITYREDKSNEKEDYLRNKIRKQLLPKMTEVFPDFLFHFQTSLSHLRKVNQFYQQSIDAAFKEIFMSGDETEFVLNKELLLLKDQAIVEEIIRKLGFTGMEIEKIKTAENGKFFRSQTHEIHIARKEIRCRKRS